MKQSILLLTLFGIAHAAHADISDSGALTIGGQAVIQSTMTVQGSAFSVGGTTFSIAGGSVTLGGQLNVAAAGIKWADGTISITAPTGGFQIVRSSGANDQSETATVWTALIGSSTTITVAANKKVWAVFNGVFSQSVDNAGCQARMMQGGTILSSTGVDCAYYAGSASARPGDCTIQHVTAPLSAGTYTFSVMFRSSSNGATCQVDGATTAPWQMVAAEAQ